MSIGPIAPSGSKNMPPEENSGLTQSQIVRIQQIESQIAQMLGSGKINSSELKADMSYLRQVLLNSKLPNNTRNSIVAAEENLALAYSAGIANQGKINPAIENSLNSSMSLLNHAIGYQ